MAKNTINLLQEQLIPKQELLTLSRVCAFWLLVLVIMLCWSFITQQQLSSLTQEHRSLTAIKVAQDAKKASLETQLQSDRVDKKLKAELDDLKVVVRYNEALHGALTNPNHTSVAGFAPAMSELAELHHKDISLAQINITIDDVTFAGTARSPESVPGWLAKLERSKFFSGKSFINFSIKENEQSLSDFVVSSKAQPLIIESEGAQP